MNSSLTHPGNLGSGFSIGPELAVDRGNTQRRPAGAGSRSGRPRRRSTTPGRRRRRSRPRRGCGVAGDIALRQIADLFHHDHEPSRSWQLRYQSGVLGVDEQIEPAVAVPIDHRELERPLRPQERSFSRRGWLSSSTKMRWAGRRPGGGSGSLPGRGRRGRAVRRREIERERRGAPLGQRVAGGPATIAIWADSSRSPVSKTRVDAERIAGAEQQADAAPGSSCR
jgi:hypothetical protein